MSHKNKEIYEFDGFRLDVSERLLSRSTGEKIMLADKVFETLCLLVRKSGSLVTKDELLETIWAGAFVEENNLDKNISALRRSLGEKKGEQIYIETVRKHGYRFLPEVRKIDASEPHVVTNETNAPRLNNTNPKFHNVEERRQKVSNQKQNTRSPQNLRQSNNIVDLAAWRHDAEPAFEDATETPRQTELKASSKADNLKIVDRIADKSPAKRKWEKTIWILAAVCLAASLVSAVFLIRRQNRHSGAALDFSSRANLRIAQLINQKLTASASGILRADFSPDGDLLTFYQAGGGKGTIYVKQIGGDDAIKITDGKWFDYSPVWSPDKQRIAFISNRDGGRAIWTIPSLGGTPVLLVRLDAPPDAIIDLTKWSRDGRRIYYQWRRNLYAIDLETKQSAAVTSLDEARSKAWDFSISPGEDAVAYSDIVDGKAQIFVESLNGGTARQITRGDGDKQHPGWFPDNRRIAYDSNQSGNKQIYVADPETSETTQITFGDASSYTPTVSPDGRKIAFLSFRAESNIYSFNLAERKEIAETANLGFQVFPIVSPDGKTLAFQSATTSHKFLQSSIKLKPFAADAQTLIVTNDGYDAKWSPDGSSLAFLRVANSRQNIWKAGANGQNERQLTTAGITVGAFSVVPFDLMSVHYAWSPDGSRIAYVSSKSGQSNLWTIAADGESETMITENADDDLLFDSPFWSPDGKRLAFLAGEKTFDGKEKQRFKICVTEANQFKSVFETESKPQIVGWSANGGEIFTAVQIGKDGEPQARADLYKIRLDGGEPELLARLSAAYPNSFKFSPRAEQIAFFSRAEDNADNLYLIRFSGGKVEKLSDNRDSAIYYSGLSWAPDESRLYYGKQMSGVTISLVSN